MYWYSQLLCKGPEYFLHHWPDKTMMWFFLCMAQYKTVFYPSHFFCLSVTSQRVTALSSDNGRQLACHATNSALFRPVETTMTMSVYCECLNLSVN